MKHYIILLSFLFLTPKDYLFASNQDSLIVLNFKNKAINLFQQQIKYDSILYYLDRMGELALENHYSDEYIFSLIARYTVNFRLEYYSNAKYFLNESLKAAENHLDKDHPFWKTIYNNQGSYFSLIGQFEKAIEMIRKSLMLLLQSLQI